MTIDASIRQYVSAIADSPEIDDGELIALLESRGVEETIAERIVRFAPVAFGRALLADLGIAFSDDFLRFDGDGNLTLSGKLSADDVFAASVASVATHSNSPAYQTIALSSAEVHSVNQALNSGSNPADLVLAPVAIFDQPPTDTGMDRAHQHLAKILQPHSPTQPQDKPWWKIW